MSNQTEVSEFSTVIVQDPATSILTLSQVGGLGVPRGTTAQRPDPGVEGMVRFNTTTALHEAFFNGEWRVMLSSNEVIPANVTSVPAFASGIGTFPSPFVLTGRTILAGTRDNVVATITVTGRRPSEFVRIVDRIASGNGGRFTVSNSVANGSGVLVFDLVFSDNSLSAADTVYSCNITIGDTAAYVSMNVTIKDIPGTTYVSRTSGTALILNDVFYDEENAVPRFVAVGDTNGTQGTILTSINSGVTWTSVNSAINTSYKGVIRGAGNRYVFVGTGGSIVTSANLGVFNSRVSGTAQTLNAIATNGVIQVAVGNNDALVTSLDNTTWTSRDNNSTDTIDLFDIHWCRTQFVAVGRSNDILNNPSVVLTSPDGITWTRQQNLPVGITFRGVTFARNKIIIVGSRDASTQVIFFSKDGITWGGVPVLDTDRNIKNPIWTGNRVIILGNNGQVLTSRDEDRFTLRSTGTVTDHLAAAFDGETLVVVGTGGGIVTSS